ncbi:MAG: IspD/TarI family cytidylyltransferase, partial [Phycisphaerales bacterium]
MTRAMNQATNRDLTGACAVVLLAGGSGTRMQQAENKVYLPVGGRTMLAWSLEVFERSPLVGSVVLVAREGDDDRASATIEQTGTRKLV